MGMFILLCLVAGVFFLFVRKSKPKDPSVKIPLLATTPLRIAFHISGITNTRVESMPAYFLFIPLLNFNLKAALPSLRDISEEDGMIAFIAPAYFDFLIDYAYSKNMNKSTMDYILKAAVFFNRNVLEFNKIYPENQIALDGPKDNNNGLDGILFAANGYLSKRTDFPIDISRDIAPSIELWCENYLFNALEYLGKFDRYSSSIVNRF